MRTHLSPVQQHLQQGALAGCSPIHAAGTQPNHMDHFLLTNTHEVLFVD